MRQKMRVRIFFFIFIFASSELWIYAQIIGGVITSVSFQFCLFWLSIWHTMSNQDCILNSIFSIIPLVENFSKARANIWCCCQILIFLYSQGYFKGKWKKFCIKRFSIWYLLQMKLYQKTEDSLNKSMLQYNLQSCSCRL